MIIKSRLSSSLSRSFFLTSSYTAVDSTTRFGNRRKDSCKFLKYRYRIISPMVSTPMCCSVFLHGNCKYNLLIINTAILGTIPGLVFVFGDNNLTITSILLEIDLGFLCSWQCFPCASSRIFQRGFTCFSLQQTIYPRPPIPPR